MVSDEDVLAALEREVERWQRIIHTIDPDRRHPHAYARDLSGTLGSAAAAAARLKRLVRAGYVRATPSPYGRAYSLTPSGSALAQQGDLRCIRCATEPVHASSTDYCTRCLAHYLHDQADGHDHAITYHQTEAVAASVLAQAARTYAEALT